MIHLYPVSAQEPPPGPQERSHAAQERRLVQPQQVSPAIDQEPAAQVAEAPEAEQITAEKALFKIPGIFQEKLPKAYELRVTVMGQSVFAAKIWSQDTVRGKLDWRKAYDELRLDTTRLDPASEKRCLALLEELGLVFGCLDFIVTPAGELYFLEVNQMGQFLFVESFTEDPLLDAFAEFLMAGRRDWVYAGQPTVRYDDVQDAVTESLKTLATEHTPAPPNSTLEPNDS